MTLNIKKNGKKDFKLIPFKLYGDAKKRLFH
jgi:hypothetical protein